MSLLARLCVTFLSLAAADLAAGQGAASTPVSRYRPGVTLPIWTLDPITQSGLQEPTERVIQDEASLRAIWTQIHSRVIKPPAVPPIDFSKEIVVVVGMGAQATTSDVLRIISVAYGYPGSAVYVMVSSEVAGKNCVVKPLLASPVEIIRFDKPPVPVLFDRHTHSVDCVPSP